MPIHQDALDILKQRSTEYPAFADEAARVCNTFNALYPDANLSPDQYTVLLVCMKLCRQTRKHKRDNLLDMINYISFLEKP